MSRPCIVKYFHLEAQKYVKKRHPLTCDKCVLRDNCKYKEE